MNTCVYPNKERYMHTLLSSNKDRGGMVVVVVVVHSHSDDVFIVIIIIEPSKSLVVIDFSSVLDIYSAHILHFNVTC